MNPKLRDEDPTDSVIQLVQTLAGPGARDRVSPSTELLQSKVLDSFGLLELIAELETRLDISVRTEDLTLENFSRVSSIVALVQRYRADGRCSP